jgi:hypothetical protein
MDRLKRWREIHWLQREDSVASYSLKGTWGYFCFLYFWRHISGDNILGRRLPSFCLPFFWFILVDCCTGHCPSFASLWLDVSWNSCLYIPFFCSISTFGYVIHGIMGGYWPAHINTLSTLDHFSLSHPCRLTHFMGSGIRGSYYARMWIPSRCTKEIWESTHILLP